MYKLFLIVLMIVATIGVTPCYAYSTEKPADVEAHELDSGDVSVYFPEVGQDPAPVLAQLYNSANKTLDIAVYSLASPVIIKAIENAKDNGIIVRVITDRLQSGLSYQRVAIADLESHNIPVKVNGHTGYMHLNMSIVDKTFVTTGSYSYLLSASETDDDMMVVITQTELIEQCQKEFNRMWESDKFMKVGVNE